MTRKDLADYIREHKDGNSLHYSYDDVSVIAQHTRKILYEHLHITESICLSVVKERPAMTSTSSSAVLLPKLIRKPGSCNGIKNRQRGGHVGDSGER